jgi:predicted DNA-binding transcriptional regulator AlpA
MSRPDDKLKLPAVLSEMGISRAAFYRMRARGKGPKVRKLPNGQIRVSRADLDRWWNGLEETA